MPEENELKISVVMPVRNGETTIGKTLESLARQTKKFEELIIVDDASSDGSVRVIKECLDGKQEYILIQNEKQKGLAAAYNEGTKAAKGDLIVTLHQDVVLENDSLENLVVPFGGQEVAVSTHRVAHPMEIWNKYNFWQKCFFARQAGKTQSGIDGKFDCFRKSALEKAGLFDEIHFRTAGEDGDMVYKLGHIGKIIFTKAKIVHLHKIDPHFGWKDIAYKQAQYSEAQGTLLRRGRVRGSKQFAKAFFREMLLVSLLVPYLNVLSALLILLYAFFYTKIIFLREYSDKRILILPFFNIFLLFVSLAYSFRGMIYGKQKI
jgi:glycosyltransferase involved in cell wall biosynthesis